MKRKSVASFLMIVLAFVGYALGDKTIKKVRVLKIQTKNLSSFIFYKGRVAQGEIVPVYIEASALIQTVMIGVGQTVEKGDELLIFSPKSIVEINKELKITKLDIEDIKLRIANFNNGSSKLKLDNKKLEIGNLEEKIKGDERKLLRLITETKTLKEKAEVYKKLLDVDSVSSIEVNKVISEVIRKESELEELSVSLELNKRKFELSAASLESLIRELDIEERKLKSTLEKFELNYEILMRRMEQLKKPLKSPIAGVVTMVDVTQGSNTFSGQRLLAILPKNERVVKFEIPAYRADDIKQNQKVIIKTRTSSEQTTHEGIISKISNIVRKSTADIQEDIVEAEVKMLKESDLKLGSAVTIMIEDKFIKNIIKVSPFSIIRIGEKDFIFTVDNGIARKIEVKIGLKTPTESEILNVPPGVEIIINPFKVVEGEKIEVVN